MSRTSHEITGHRTECTSMYGFPQYPNLFPGCFLDLSMVWGVCARIRVCDVAAKTLCGGTTAVCRGMTRTVLLTSHVPPPELTHTDAVRATA